MSESSSDAPPDESSSTLYNPPAVDSTPSAPEDDTVALRLTLSEERAERLQAVAQQLGLTPSTIAKRAIEMVCDEVVTIQEDNRSPTVLVEQYQARIDLLHAVDDESAPAASAEEDSSDEENSSDNVESSEDEE